MPPIYFASSNSNKNALARHVCLAHNIPLEQVVLDIDEIQGEDPEHIITTKVTAAYGAFQKPIFVSDDSWNITALRGFPGPYMKSINHWFRHEDFIRLMAGLPDRSVTLHQYLAYYDGQDVVLFSNQVNGTILEKPAGCHDSSPWSCMVSLEGDEGRSIAEVFADADETRGAHKLEKRHDVWQQAVIWYKEKHS